jgi:long-subunit acyl-CoA synthetase (AMP-forming)
VHSGDLGNFDKKNNLRITGRLKELIITAGGENVAPILIEENIKLAIPFVSNAMVIGEGRKYLLCILTIKNEGLASQPPCYELGDCKKILEKFDVKNVQNVQDVMSNAIIKKIAQDGNLFWFNRNRN